MSAKIVVVGSCMTDLVSYTPILPRPGETIHGHRFVVGFGGKGANQCVAAAKLGASTSLVAKIGNDTFGHNYMKNLQDNGIDTDNVGVCMDAATGVATITVDDKGENSIVIVAGANLKMTVDDVHEAEALLQEAKLVVCQGEISMEATLATLKSAQKHGVMTLMNAAPVVHNLDPEIIKASDIFCVNEMEAETLIQKSVKTISEAEEAAKLLLAKGCKSVILTLGEEGALYLNSNGQKVHVPAPKVTPVDTTGAGDAFVGALAFYLVNLPHLTMEEMIKRACKIASVSVQGAGTQSSYPRKKDLPQELFH
ncbi:ribokinase [Oratosquilla oratoria]|uniref:ribokinase n=1 Tax=Oratosquilla oratoria TaxID=337810 RepID=UPI003F76F973